MDKSLIPSLEVVKKACEHLNSEQPVRTLELTEEERVLLKQHSFLTDKKMLYVANIGENEEGDNYVEELRECAERRFYEIDREDGTGDFGRKIGRFKAKGNSYRITSPALVNTSLQHRIRDEDSGHTDALCAL